MFLFRCLSKLVFFIGFYNKVICSNFICNYKCSYKGEEEKLSVNCGLDFLNNLCSEKFSTDNFFFTIKKELKKYENREISDADINIIKKSFSDKIFKKNEYWVLFFDVEPESKICKFNYIFKTEGLTEVQKSKYIGFIKKRYITNVTDENGKVIGETMNNYEYINKEGVASIYSCDINGDDVVCTILIDDKKFVDFPKFSLKLKDFSSEEMEKAFQDLFKKKLEERLEYGITQGEIDNEFVDNSAFRSNLKNRFAKDYFCFNEYGYKSKKSKYAYRYECYIEKEELNSFKITLYFEGVSDESKEGYQIRPIFYRNSNIPLELVNANIFKYLELIDDVYEKKNFKIFYVREILKYIDKNKNTYVGFIGEIIGIIDDIIKEYRNRIEKFIKDYVEKKYDKIVKNTKEYEENIYKEIIKFLKSNKYSETMEYILTKNINDENNYKSFEISELDEKNVEQIEAIKLISEEYVKKSINNLKNTLINKINDYCEKELKISDIYDASVANYGILKQKIINYIKKFCNDKKYGIDDETLNNFDYSFIFNKIIDLLKEEYVKSKNLSTKSKDELKVDFDENKKENDSNNIIKNFKEFLKVKFIEEKYINAYKYADFKNDYNSELLKSLSEIFVNEVIKNEKENVIDKITNDENYIENLQNKKEKYNKKDDKDKDKYTNIETLLNNKKTEEDIIEIKYEVEHINKIITELNKKIDSKLEEIKKTKISDFIDSEKTKINAFKDLNKLTDYLTNFNKNKDEAGSIKQLLKNKLNNAGFKDVDIKEDDYKSLDTLATCINAKQTEIKEEMKKQMNENNKKKLETIEKKINEICDEIIKEIEKITKREDIKNYEYKENASITNHINEELVKIEDYNKFIKEKIGETGQTYEYLIKTTIGTKVTAIINKYEERNSILSIVNIEYTLSDEDKITDDGKNEFNKLTNEKYKKFDSRKTYKDLYNMLKPVSAYFKNIDLVDASTLISIENKDEVIDKDNVTINIKLVDSCYKKEKPKEEDKDDEDKHNEEDKNKDKHNEDDGKNKDDNENNDKNTGEDIEDIEEGVKKKGCCTSSNGNKKKTKNKDVVKKKGCCKK